jgi:hypothetical protein
MVGGGKNTEEKGATSGGAVKPEDGEPPQPAAVLAEFFANMQSVFQDQLNRLSAPSDASGSHPRVGANADNSQNKAVMDVLKSRFRALNVKAGDMAQELTSFFRPIEAYFNVAGVVNETNRVIILESTMGEDCLRAMTGISQESRATFAAYKEAIQKRYSVIQDPVHVLSLLHQTTMAVDESTKDFVTRLWTLVARLTTMPADWREHEVLSTLRNGHSNEDVRTLLMKEQPKTVAEAERLIEEFEVRVRARSATTKFVNAMSSSGSAQPVENVQGAGGYRGPKSRGGGSGQRGGANRGGTNSQNRVSGNVTCYRCGKQGHIARVCRAPAPANNGQGVSRQSGFDRPDRGGRPDTGGRSFNNNPGRAISNVNASSQYSDYAATREQQQFDAWQPSVLPEFPTPDESEATQYGGWSHQDEVVPAERILQRVEYGAGLTYGYGTPHRRHYEARRPLQARTEEAAPLPVRTHHKEWWVTSKFPRAEYFLKVDTGARVNIMSVADLSRVGYVLDDLRPSSMYLVGFNAAVVKPRGELPVQITVNGKTFDTVFQVVDRCNSPLLSLHDSEQAGLVNRAHSVSVSAPISEFHCYKHEVIHLALKPEAH